MTYSDCSIPSRLFFEIVDKGDYSLLGFKTDAENNEAFEKIFDEYYELTNSSRIKIDLSIRSDISMLTYKLKTVEFTFESIVNLPMTDAQRGELIDSLNELGVKIDKEKDIIEQIENLKRTYLGGIRNKLSLLNDKYESLKKSSGVKTSYEKMLVNIENVLERSIPEDISLRKFLAYEQSVKEKIAQQKQRR
jgi:seryl-tRNA synthetase